MLKKIEKEILEYIKVKKIVKTKDIEKEFKLPQSSARRYLINLEKNNHINRLFGEIIINENEDFKDHDFFKRINSNKNEKINISKEASKFIQDYKTIFIDSGSLCYFLLEFLDKNIQIFTNSLSNANRAIELGFKDVNILGGKIKTKTMSIVDLEKNQISNINFPISFFGVNAIDLDGNLYTPEQREARTKNLIMNKSKISIILAEQHKIDKKSTFVFDSKKTKKIIVTNSKIKNLKNKKIQIINV